METSRRRWKAGKSTGLQVFLVTIKQRSTVLQEVRFRRSTVSMKGCTVRKLLLRMPRDAQLQRDVEGRYVATDATLRPPLPGDLFAAGKPDPRTMCCRNDIWKSPVAEHWGVARPFTCPLS